MPQSTQKRAITNWSGPIYSLLGYRPADVECTLEWWLALIHEEDRPEVSSELNVQLTPARGNPCASDSRIWGCDYRIRHSQGHYVLVSDRSTTTRDGLGNAVHINSVVFDKERKRSERKVNEQRMSAQNHLVTIANNTPSGIYMLDPQGYTIYMNTAGTLTSTFTLACVVITDLF